MIDFRSIAAARQAMVDMRVNPNLGISLSTTEAIDLADKIIAAYVGKTVEELNDWHE